jgi:hypothetical protein
VGLDRVADKYCSTKTKNPSLDPVLDRFHAAEQAEQAELIHKSNSTGFRKVYAVIIPFGHPLLAEDKLLHA